MLDRWEHASEYLEPQIFLVAQSVCAALDDANLVVQTFHEPKRDLILCLAIGSDSIPMPINHLSEFLVGFETLPLQARAPVLEETPCPALTLVVPELAEGFLEQVRRVQALVGRQQRLERLPAFQGQVLVTREQCVFLSFDVATILAAEPRVLALSYLVERFSQVAHDVELVKQDRGLRRTRKGCIAKRLPHIHHRQPNATALLVSEPVIELRHARLRAILAAEPDRAMANQVAHHDAVGVALADRDLVDADRLGSGRARADELRLHVLLLQRLDRIPVQVQLLGNVLDRRLSAAPAHVMGKALGIEGIVGQKLQPFAFHFAAASALHAPHLDLQEDALVPTREIANASRTSVVPARMNSPATAADCFFERRTRVMTRAFGSPNTPRTVCCGRNPGNAYASHRRRWRFVELAIRTCCPIHAPCETPASQYSCGFQPLFSLDLPTRFPDEPKKLTQHEIIKKYHIAFL